MLHTHAIEKRAAVGGTDVGVGFRAGHAGEICGNGLKRCCRVDVGGAFKPISARGNALSSDLSPRRTVRHADHSQHGKVVGGICIRARFAVIVHAVAVVVGEIRRTVRGQTILLRPSVRQHRRWRLKLIRTNVERAAGNARTPRKISRAGSISVVAGVDTRGI